VKKPKRMPMRVPPPYRRAGRPRQVIAQMKVSSKEEREREAERIRRETEAEFARIQQHAQQEIASAGKLAGSKCSGLPRSWRSTWRSRRCGRACRRRRKRLTQHLHRRNRRSTSHLVDQMTSSLVNRYANALVDVVYRIGRYRSARPSSS